MEEVQVPLADIIWLLVSGLPLANESAAAGMSVMYYNYRNSVWIAAF